MRAAGAGGICDAAPVLDRLSRDGDDAAEAAGWPFFGQLIAHDITADRSSIIGGVDPEAQRNARAPKLNLEIVYSDGPIGSPYLFDRVTRRSSCSARTAAACRATSKAWP
jgi:hypothetical protein